MPLSPQIRLYLVRHGLAEGAEGRAVGHLDLPLSDSGAASVRALAASWQGPPPDAVQASDLRRAADTAGLLAESWGLPVTIDPRLREMSFGEWEGRNWEEIEARDGERFTAWSDSGWSLPAPGGESCLDLAERTRTWLADVLAGPPGRTVVAVAHGGSLRALLGQALVLSPERIFHLRLDPAQVSGLSSSPRGLEVLFVNASRFP